jgi:hypothetical protein
MRIVLSLLLADTSVVAQISPLVRPRPRPGPSFGWLAQRDWRRPCGAELNSAPIGAAGPGGRSDGGGWRRSL